MIIIIQAASGCEKKCQNSVLIGGQSATQGHIN